MNILTYLTIISIIIIKINNVGAIEDGEEGRWKKFKYMASLWYKRNGRFQYICSASILTRRHILTAAHCVVNRSPDDFYVITGFPNIAHVDLTNFMDLPERLSLWSCFSFAMSDCATISTISRILTHRDYKVSPYGPIRTSEFNHPPADIAMIGLTESLPLLNNAKITLPTKRAVTRMDCTVAGWGMTNPCSAVPKPSPTLTYARYITISREECHVPIREKEFCADPVEGFALPGDSGSPLVCDGVTIGIFVTGSPGAPGIFVDIFKEMAFISAGLART